MLDIIIVGMTLILAYGDTLLGKMGGQGIDCMESKVGLLSSSGIDISFTSLGVRVTDKQIIQEVFEQTVRNAYQQGLIENDENGSVFSDMLYPFYSRYVLCI